MERKIMRDVEKRVEREIRAGRVGMEIRGCSMERYRKKSTDYGGGVGVERGGIRDGVVVER